VDLQLDQEPGMAPVHEATVVIATVSGDEVWRGLARRDGAVAHLKVPAGKLRPDDYIVSVQGASRYYLRVRAY